MARVNVEESAIAAARRIARKTGMSQFDLLGRLVVLWRESQTLERTNADIEDLRDWLGDPVCLEEIVAGLVEYEILLPVGSRWEIVGNEKHIEALRQKKEAGREGGKLGGRPRKTQQGLNEEPIRVSENNPPGLSTPFQKENPPGNPNAVQFNAVQCISPQPPKGPDVGIPAEVKSEWEKTLKHYGRDPNWARDEAPLYRIFQKTKDWTRIKNALAGYRFEIKKPDYDPSQFVFIHRLDDPGKLAYLEALGEGKKPPERRIYEVTPC